MQSTTQWAPCPSSRNKKWRSRWAWGLLSPLFSPHPPLSWTRTISNVKITVAVALLREAGEPIPPLFPSLGRLNSGPVGTSPLPLPTNPEGRGDWVVQWFWRFTTLGVLKIDDYLLHLVKITILSVQFYEFWKTRTAVWLTVKIQNSCTPSQIFHAPGSPPCIHPTPGNHWSVLYPYRFASYRMSRKWNQVLHHLLSEASFP